MGEVVKMPDPSERTTQKQLMAAAIKTSLHFTKVTTLRSHYLPERDHDWVARQYAAVRRQDSHIIRTRGRRTAGRDIFTRANNGR